jgi:hypothetical protein
MFAIWEGRGFFKESRIQETEVRIQTIDSNVFKSE